jgi:PKD repeat protein
MSLKNGLTALALCLSLLLQAGHELGGIIITYESVLGATGDSLKYELKVYAVYDKFGVTPPPSLNISLSSSCFSNSMFNLPSSGGSNGLLPLIGADYCTSTNSINSSNGLAIYSDTITLPGKCADFKFYYSGGFGRYNNTANIQNSFQTAYFFADLNNLYGPNSAPTSSVNGLIQASCLNYPLNLYGFTESDGDSVAYSASAPSYISGTAVLNFGFNPGYSLANPVNSNLGYSVDVNTGLVQTQLSTVGNFILTIEYNEYRKDTANNSILIGKGKYIMYLVGSSSCNTAPFDLVLLNDLQQDSIQCGQSEIKLKTTRKIAANTLTNNGSEFVVTSAKNGALTVNSAYITSDSIVTLVMQQNITSSDTLVIWGKNGSDANVLISTCGKSLTEYQDTLVYLSPSSAPPIAQFNFTRSGYVADFNANLPADSIIWNFGDGNSSFGDLTPSHQYSGGGTYIVQLIVFNSCGLSDTATQSVIICDPISSGINHVTSGDSVFFSTINALPSYSYYWNLGDGFVQFDSSFYHQYGVDSTYTVTLTIVNTCGDSALYTVNVEYCKAPKALWTASILSTAGSGMIVQFDGSSSKGLGTFIWDFGDGNTNTTTLTPIHNYATADLSLLVKLIITNNCNDVDTTAYTLGQIGIPENNYALFTIHPNPTNNEITITGIDDWHLTIYDIFGREVLTQDSEQGKTIGVKHLSAGSYIYQIKTPEGQVKRDRLIIQ